jgi:dolichol-phosphate mannosyltransferase
MGSGRAILTGFSAAGCNLVTYIGADGQFAPRELIRFFPAIDNSDIVVAFRSSRCDYSAYRLFNSFVYLYLIYILFSLKIKDINWVHLYKREAIKGIKINSSGVFMLGEMLIKAKEKGFKIAEVETSYFPRRAGKAKCSKPAVALKAFSEIFRLWFRMKLGIDRNE